jgi:NAD(P)-dependent dehydrogenase (short-subunit alcohol dehydrogenase family)
MSTLLITGAGRGIGHELARRALDRGDEVYAVVRKDTDRQKFDSRPNLHAVVMDVSDTASVQKGYEQLDGLLGGRQLDAVVHAAAISKPNAVETCSVDEFSETLNTNTLGALRILKGAIPRLRGHDGRLILLTSLWGKASGPLLSSYCASKHAIESLADTARRETAGMNMHIVLVEPGVVKTEMLTSQAGDIDALLTKLSPEETRHYGNLYRRYSKLTIASEKSAITAAKCAAVIEKALSDRRPRTRYRAGMDSRLVCFLTWLLPDRWMDAIVAGTLNNKPL